MPTRKTHTILCAFIVMLAAIPSVAASEGSTDVSIDGARFLINGSVTYPGTEVEGFLLNSRMIQAVYDDENQSTSVAWAYPDTGLWDPNRNVDEFIASVPSYAEAGLGAVTIGLQGGHPGEYARDRIVSAFAPNGSLKAPWLDRLDRALSACDAAGVVVILSLFYQLQDHLLTDDTAVQRGVDNIVDWLAARGHEHVILEIANESSIANYEAHPILQPARIHELIVRAQQRSGGSLPVSTSFPGGAMPPASVRAVADLFLMHGNALTPDELTTKVAMLRSKPEYQSDPRPIVFNEASTSVDLMDAAVSAEASWGYYDQGENNYQDGFQSLPVNWTINTALKRAFFARVGWYAGSGTGSGPDTVSPSAPTGLSAAASSHERVDLSWAASTDDVGVIGYEVFRDGILRASGVGATSYADLSVGPSTTYTYRVFARDAAGNRSPPSAPASVTTPVGSLFWDDFETGGLSRWSNSSDFIVQRNEVHQGLFAGRAVSSGRGSYAARELGMSQTELFASFRVFVVDRGNKEFALIRYKTESDTAVLKLYVNASGRLCVGDEVSPSQSACSITLPGGTWHEIQFRVRVGDPGGRSDVWVNDAAVPALGKALGLGVDPLGRFEIGDPANGRHFDVVFDDVELRPTFIT